jgi:hypothetical protein
MIPTIVVTYTPRYSGCHRICFKTTGAEYCCYQDDSPSVINTAKTVEILLSDYVDCLVDIPTDLPTCDVAVTVTGYIQPCCSDINSNQNKVLFVTPFPETTPCTSYFVECSDPDCGTFTVTDCNGEDDGTEYELRSDPGSVTYISVCSGGDGPIGAGYSITFAETSCCVCKLYQVTVISPIDIYYTDCNQTIDVISVSDDPVGVTVCAAENSVWPVNKTDNDFILSITEVGDCIPND